jgi:DNA-binding transcriptional ArsR family regulator
MAQALYYKIINLLKENEELTPTDIWIKIRDYSYENIMENLKRLLKDDIIRKRKEGKNSLYSINAEKVGFLK